MLLRTACETTLRRSKSPSALELRASEGARPFRKARGTQPPITRILHARRSGTSIARIGSTLGTSIARTLRARRSFSSLKEVLGRSLKEVLVFLAKESAGSTPTPPCQQILDGIPLLALARRSTTSFACVGIYSRFLQGRSGRCANGIPRGPVVTNSL